MSDAAPEPDFRTASAEAALRRWIDRFNAHDADGLLALYHPLAVLVPTTSPTVLSSPAAIRGYFGRVFERRPGPSATLDQVHGRVRADTAICSGLYSLRLTTPEGVRTALARFSFSFWRVDGAWLIADHHSSFAPVAPT